MELFRRILQTAVEGGASDIHLNIGVPVSFRINRQLFPIEAPTPTADWLQGVVEQIVPKHSQKALDEEREVDFSYAMTGVGRFRINVFQQKGEWSCSIRHVKTKVPSFEDLKLLPILKRIAEAPRGIILVAGASGCGKSTTLAALLQHINTSSKRHIITLEDPIEYVFEDSQSIIEQREIGLDTPTFTSGLKYILRQDPDIIMIGEMRDAQSFNTAMTAADTGHLVLSTLHTATASLAIGRILDFFKADEREQIRRQLAATLQAVICQRLVTTVTGVVIPAFEIMINTPTVRIMLEENKLDRLPVVIEMGVEEGMMTFNQSLFQLVKSRIVTEKEALAKASNPHALEMNFKGIFLDENRRILGGAESSRGVDL